MVGVYPDFFSLETTIVSSVPSAGHVKVAIYDVLGREVMVLHDGSLGAGVHLRSLDASDWTSGVYFVRVETQGISAAKRVTLMK